MDGGNNFFIVIFFKLHNNKFKKSDVLREEYLL